MKNSTFIDTRLGRYSVGARLGGSIRSRFS